MTQRLLHLPPDVVMNAAAQLDLTDFVTGSTIRWQPTDVQHACLRTRHRHQRLFVAKPRRIYVSTVFDLDDAMFAAVNNSNGSRVRVGVALDTDEHTSERTWQMSSFLKQQGIAHKKQDGLITFPGKESQIVVFTAGGKRAGASTGYQRMRYSEAAYYKAGQIATISAAVGQAGQEIIETTIGSHAENFIEIRRRWRTGGQWGAYEPFFLSFEMHEKYRLPDDACTDEEWEAMKARGFSIRGAAAYWLRICMEKTCGNDEARAKGEYPQIEEDMFEAAGGRYIKKTPKVADVFESIPVHGMRGDTWTVHLHVDPSLCSGTFISAVDTSGAVGESSSAVVSIDAESGEIVASVGDERMKHDDLARCAQVIQRRLHIDRRRPITMASSLHVEDNGIGEATCTELNTLGVEFVRFHQEGGADGSTTEECMLEAKTLIESGRVWEAPEQMCNECDEVSKQERKFKGRKDYLMCLGMAAVRRKEAYGHVNEESPEEKAWKRERLDFEQRMREDALERRVVPPWGRG